jgi:hypothetical protein
MFLRIQMLDYHYWKYKVTRHAGPDPASSSFMIQNDSGFPFDFAQGGEHVERRISRCIASLVRNDSCSDYDTAPMGPNYLLAKITTAQNFCKSVAPISDSIPCWARPGSKSVPLLGT